MKPLFLLLAALLVFGCSESTVTGPEAAAELSAETTSELALKKGGKDGKVVVCHVSEDKPDELKRLEVSAGAEQAHIAHGDPQVWVEVDDNCEPLCPCWTEEELAEQDWWFGRATPRDGVRLVTHDNLRFFAQPELTTPRARPALCRISEYPRGVMVRDRALTEKQVETCIDQLRDILVAENLPPRRRGW